MIDWAHAGPSVLAAFLASLVEFVEALTVVLAVGTVRGWRSALAGAGLALLTLAILVIALGPALARIPLATVQLVVGTLLLLFGLRWLRKAILRAAGIVALHDETAAYAAETDLLSHSPRHAPRRVGYRGGDGLVQDRHARGYRGGLHRHRHRRRQRPAAYPPASAPGLRCCWSLRSAIALHRPLARIPENTLKFLVGVLLSAFGAFWVGEGAGLAWPGADWSILGLIAAFLALALSMVALCRARSISVERPT